MQFFNDDFARKTMPADIPVFVNSCDSFSDCWPPFFTLLAKHWPGKPPRIYLTTEERDFSFPGLDITCLKVGKGRASRPLPWGECVIRALDKIEDDLFLYIHEDCFIDRPVRLDLIEEFAALMRKDNIANIRLIEFDGSGPWQPTKYPLLWEVDRNSAYRMSTQAGLWQRDRLRACIRRHENPWQFEIWGSKRAQRMKDRILCINRDLFGPAGDPVLSYDSADAVLKGKWNLEVVERLFARHEIYVDFAERGTCEDGVPRMPRAPFIQRLSARVRSYF